MGTSNYDDEFNILPKRHSLWQFLKRSSRSNNSPAISTCTTSTNLSGFEGEFGSSQFRQNRLHMEQNLLNCQQEFQSLNRERKDIEIDIPHERQRTRLNAFQVLATISVSLVSCCVGFISAYTSPTEDSLMKDLDITLHQFSWIGSIMPLIALKGGLIGGPLIELIGRKSTIFVTNVLFVISWILIATASNVYSIYAGRAFAGVAVGINTLVLPVYLGETLQPEVRGMLGLFPTAFGNAGILFCFIAGSYVNWSVLAYIGIGMTVPFFILMFFISDTPRWYISKRKYDQAEAVLIKLRGCDNYEKEYNDLKSTINDTGKSIEFKQLFKSANVKVILISLGLMLFQQFSGINAVIFYTTTIFKLANTSLNEYYCTIILGVVNFCSTFIATLIIDRLGRKILLYLSAAGMVVTLFSLSAYFFVKDNLQLSEINSYGWVPLASLVVYVLAFSLGFGPIPWLMMGEILPAKIRGPAASISTAFNWLCTFLVTKSFANFIDSFQTYGTFLLFGVICILSLIFIKFCVPETSGRTLEDIEESLTKGKRVIRMSSKTNLKPMPTTMS